MPLNLNLNPNDHPNARRSDESQSRPSGLSALLSKVYSPNISVGGKDYGRFPYLQHSAKDIRACCDGNVDFRTVNRIELNPIKLGDEATRPAKNKFARKLFFQSAVNSLCEGVQCGMERESIINALSDMPSEQRTPEFIEQCKSLCKGVRAGWDRKTIINALSLMSSEQRTPEFIEQCKILCEGLPEHDRWGRSSVIGTLSLMSSEQRTPEFIEQCKSLFEGVSDGRDRKYIIIALLNISSEQRTPEFIEQCKSLCEVVQHSFYRDSTITSLSKMPSEQRTPELIEQCKSLCEGMPNGRGVTGGRDRKSIIIALLNISSEQRTQRYQRLVEFRDGRDDRENNPLSALQIIQGLETPLDQDLLLDANGMQQLAAQGATFINVHNDGRDERTSEALQQLWTLGGSLNDQLIDQIYAQVVGSLAKDQATGALQALGERPITSDWPRLNDQPINFGTSSFPGKELIARLYLFIEKEPQQDQDNLFIGLIGALDDGKDQCHAGKAQRLVIAVIQGSAQLPDVDIDEMEKDIKDDKQLLAKNAVLEFQRQRTAGDILAEYPVTDVDTTEFVNLKQRLVKAVAAYLENAPAVDKELFNQQFNELNLFAESDEHRL